VFDIRKWKYSQSRAKPTPEYGRGKDWGRPTRFRFNPHVGLSLEIELGFDCRNREDTKLIRELVDVLLAIRDKSRP